MADDHLINRLVSRVDHGSSEPPTLGCLAMSDMSGQIIIPEIGLLTTIKYIHKDEIGMSFSFTKTAYFSTLRSFWGQYSLIISIIWPIDPRYPKIKAKFLNEER